MKSFLLFLFLGIFSAASAQNILSNGNMEYGDGGWYLWNNPDGPADVVSEIAVPGKGVNNSQGAVITIRKKPKAWWGLQLQPPKFLADSTFYTLQFKAKGSGNLGMAVQGGPPDYRQKESGIVSLTPEWKTYSLLFLADQKGYGLNNVVFQLGYITGTVSIDDVEILPAQTADSSWYSNADARIDSLRKVAFTVPAKPGEKVTVELIRHAFPFGTALALYDSKDSVEKWYRRTAAKYFWAGVNENLFKWPEYEPKKNKPKRKEMQEYLDFAKENGWDFRAHTLIWGHQGYGFDKHWSVQGSCKDIEKNIKNRIERDLKEYRGKIKEYDVWNEPFHEAFLFEKCGWHSLDSAFVWAHRADPDAKLYINEYNVVAAGETDLYYEIIKGLLDRKIPIHGIGVQGHFQTRPVLPSIIKSRLDKLGSLGLPVKITELDFGSSDYGLHISEKEQAEYYEMFIKTAFSHPAVAGIMLWGFWDNRHWIKNGGIIAADGRAKPAADTIYKLWHEIWTTKETAAAGNDGLAHFRGFPGKYKITAGNKTEEKWIQ
ncbi:MAG: endo-1,4-beta-xylanase [Fibrobacter sp.]|jgi:endo-1,4-beta-xylanase|nr:endo-1,4-beta-xylanase [Fibrobacter sp.]